MLKSPVYIYIYTYISLSCCLHLPPSLLPHQDASALLARTLQLDAALHRATHTLLARSTRRSSPLLSSFLFATTISLRERFAPPVLAAPRDEEEVDEPRPLGEVYSCSRPSTSSAAIVFAREIHARATLLRCKIPPRGEFFNENREEKVFRISGVDVPAAFYQVRSRRSTFPAER